MGYAIGVDFGSLSARAMAVHTADGSVLKEAQYVYPHGIMKEKLPSGRELEPGTALQHPADYLEAWHAVIQEILRDGELDPKQVVGVGIDFTQCTMLPVDRDGAPLCMDPEFWDEPHAYAKLWMHHSAQREADEITELAARRKEKFLEYYGGKISSEFMHPKILETLRRAPEVYRRADQFVEGADWITRMITGSPVRSRSIAAVAALWREEEGYPSTAFLRELHPELESLNDKLCGTLVVPGTCVGTISPREAAATGLPPGTPVACGLGDSHAAFAGSGLCEEGSMLMVIGTSGCDILISREQVPVKGFCGICRDSAIPGYYGYEAGQACMGDHFRWFMENCLPASFTEEAKRDNCSVYQLMDRKAGALRPGGSGLLALDWWNGCRSVLMDSSLSGCLFGLTLETRPEEIYRALIEGIAFGKKMITRQMETAGVNCLRLYATGGVAWKNPLVMQIMADVLGMEITVADTANGSCMGSAMYGAVAAGRNGGGHDSIQEAVRAMGRRTGRIYAPDQEAAAVYESLFDIYRKLYDGLGGKGPGAGGTGDGGSCLKELAAVKRRSREIQGTRQA